jgi:hypothetical protein
VQGGWAATRVVPAAHDDREGAVWERRRPGENNTCPVTRPAGSTKPLAETNQTNYTIGVAIGFTPVVGPEAVTAPHAGGNTLNIDEVFRDACTRAELSAYVDLLLDAGRAAEAEAVRLILPLQTALKRRNVLLYATRVEALVRAMGAIPDSATPPFARSKWEDVLLAVADWHKRSRARADGVEMQRLIADIESLGKTKVAKHFAYPPIDRRFALDPNRECKR